MDDFTSPKRVLAARGLRPRKRLGQNFLVDTRFAARIAAQLPDEAFVVEIGGGTGALTEALAQRARAVDLLEVDRGLASVLRQRFAHLADRVRIVETDALEDDLGARLASAARPRVVCGNLPYSITTPLLERIIATADLWECAIIMVQREYARRMRARPGTADYSSLSIFVQHFCQVEHLFDAGASGFYPAPAVASSVIKLTPRPHVDEGLADPALFAWLVRAAFAQRRKTLLNSVGAQPGAPSHAVLSEAMRRSGAPEGVRGERLAHDDFVMLANALQAQGFRAPAR